MNDLLKTQESKLLVLLGIISRSILNFMAEGLLSARGIEPRSIALPTTILAVELHRSRMGGQLRVMRSLGGGAVGDVR